MDERDFYQKVTSHVGPEGPDGAKQRDLEWLGCRAAGDPDPWEYRGDGTGRLVRTGRAQRRTPGHAMSGPTALTSSVADRIGGAGLSAEPIVTEHEVYIRLRPTGMTLAVPLAEISRCDWEDLEPVLAGRRNGRILGHLTRIVGYYSQTRNWNPSKKAELKERHSAREHYRVPAAAAPGKELTLP